MPSMPLQALFQSFRPLIEENFAKARTDGGVRVLNVSYRLKKLLMAGEKG